MAMIRQFAFIAYVSLICSLASSRSATAEGGIPTLQDAVSNGGATAELYNAAGSYIKTNLTHPTGKAIRVKASPKNTRAETLAEYLCAEGLEDVATNIPFDLDGGNKYHSIPKLFTIGTAKYLSQRSINLAIPKVKCSEPNSANIVTAQIKPPNTTWDTVTCLISADGQPIQAKAFLNPHSGDTIDILEPQMSEICGSQVQFWKQYVSKMVSAGTNYAKQEFKAEP